MAMYRVRVIGTGVVGSPYYNNFYFAGENPQAAVDAVGRFFDEAQPLYTTFLSYSCEPEVSIINPVTGDTVASQPVSPWTFAGLATGDILPTQVTALVKLRTGIYFSGRQVQGRFNFSGLTEAAQNNGAFLNETTRVDLQTALNTAVAELGDEEWVVWSRKNGAQVLVTGYTVESALATLRTRGSRG